MSLNRRQFLYAMAAASMAFPVSGFANSLLSGQGKKSRFYSARADLDGRYFLSGFDGDGRVLFATPLPSRGHGLAVHPLLPHVAASARRPGTYLMVVDSDSGEVLFHQESAESRHFYGHSLYSADGRYLYTTENDVERGDGKIGVWDVNKGYQKIAEFDAHGIGPHELRMLSDGKTLVIANGGILTRPETGRSKLNLDTMSPSLVYLDSESGKLLEQHKLPEAMHQNSIRHFAVNQRDEVCFAMQYQGSPADQPPLVGVHRRGETIQLLEAPQAIQRQMRNYCGSVCPDPSGQWFAISSPKGNLVTFWSASERRYVGSVEVADGCGIAAGGDTGEFLLSSGGGGLYCYQLADGELVALEAGEPLATHWDNHISRG